MTTIQELDDLVKQAMRKGEELKSQVANIRKGRTMTTEHLCKTDPLLEVSQRAVTDALKDAVLRMVNDRDVLLEACRYPDYEEETHSLLMEAANLITEEHPHLAAWLIAKHAKEINAIIKAEGAEL